MTETSVRISSVALIGGVAAVLLVLAFFAALFSGRFWVVLSGVVGALLLVAGGLILVSAIIFAKRNARTVEHVSVPDGGGVTIIEAPSPNAARRAIAESPEFLSNGSMGSSKQAELPASKAAAQQPTGAPRPAWMDGQLGRVGDVYRTTVKVGPTFSRTECEKQLPSALDDAVSTYADHLLGEGRGQLVHLPAAYIRNHLVRDEWGEQRETTYDTMFILHELLEFDREANEAIEANYRQSVVRGRLAYTAAGGGLVLGLLTILFGYLKLDTLSRGYYTGRLRLTAVAAILALAAVAGLLVMA